MDKGISAGCIQFSNRQFYIMISSPSTHALILHWQIFTCNPSSLISLLNTQKTFFLLLWNKSDLQKFSSTSFHADILIFRCLKAIYYPQPLTTSLVISTFSHAANIHTLKTSHPQLFRWRAQWHWKPGSDMKPLKLHKTEVHSSRFSYVAERESSASQACAFINNTCLFGPYPLQNTFQRIHELWRLT